MKKRLKEMEEEAAALREMQAKVEKEMGGVPGPNPLFFFALFLGFSISLVAFDHPIHSRSLLAFYGSLIAHLIMIIPRRYLRLSFYLEMQFLFLVDFKDWLQFLLLDLLVDNTLFDFLEYLFSETM